MEQWILWKYQCVKYWSMLTNIWTKEIKWCKVKKYTYGWEKKHFAYYSIRLSTVKYQEIFVINVLTVAIFTIGSDKIAPC